MHHQFTAVFSPKTKRSGVLSIPNVANAYTRKFNFQFLSLEVDNLNLTHYFNSLQGDCVRQPRAKDSMPLSPNRLLGKGQIGNEEGKSNEEDLPTNRYRCSICMETRESKCYTKK